MEAISMNMKERRRLEVFGRVGRGELTLKKGAELLGLGYRQAKRSYGRYRELGDVALSHGLRGRASNRRGNALRARAVALHQEKYRDFGPTLACEFMAREDGLAVAPESLRQWLLAEGLWQRRRRRGPHRRRRTRKEHRGEMLQMDGSHHDWFEGRRDWAVLMVAIDDASSEVYARFFEEETLAAAMRTFWRYIELHGVPHSLYVDRDSIYRSDRESTPDEVLQGKTPCTQFGRAMEELGVRLIMANSPQAKGRVERCNGTLQDRLVKSMRLRRISDLETANRFLEEEFLKDFNERFAVAPAAKANLHRGVASDLDLALVFSVRERRSVQRDWTVRWHNRWLQLSASNRDVSLPGRRVTVCEQLDGTLHVLYNNHRLEWTAIASPPPKSRQPKRTGPTRSSQGQKPAADHPWRRAQRVSTPTPGAGAPAVGAACFATAR